MRCLPAYAILGVGIFFAATNPASSEPIPSSKGAPVLSPALQPKEPLLAAMAGNTVHIGVSGPVTVNQGAGFLNDAQRTKYSALVMKRLEEK